MLVARQSHCKRRKQQELLRSRRDLPGWSSPSSLTPGRRGCLHRAGTPLPHPRPRLAQEFANSSLAFLAEDSDAPPWAEPDLLQAESPGVPSPRARRGRGFPGAPHRLQVSSERQPCP